MRPWMKILPLRMRHWIICRWKQGYRTYCVGHGPNRAKYLANGSKVETRRGNQLVR